MKTTTHSIDHELERAVLMSLVTPQQKESSRILPNIPWMSLSAWLKPQV